MHLNHIHLKSADLSASCKFYEEFFGFRFVFAQDTLHFLVNDDGFLLALDQYPVGEHHAVFPKWFHFGFCQDSSEKVEQMYEKMCKSGVKIVEDFNCQPGEWSDFKVADPGGYMVEVSWHREDCEKAPELVAAGQRAAAQRAAKSAG
jgi:lactoylglutathione lyase